MLIVYVNTLQPVNLLYFTQQVRLYGLYTLDFQDVVRVNRTFCQLVTGFNGITVGNLKP